MNAAVERLLDAREAQGFPRRVTDPGALAVIAAQLAGNESEQRDNPRASLRRQSRRSDRQERVA